jgi:hypothetical protein
METIYTRYSQREASFENTLSLLQDLLNERLLPGWRRIWVHGSNSGRTRLCFTIFPTNGDYTMRFHTLGSLRQFRADGDINTEIELIEQLINSFSQSALSDII